MFTLPMKLSSQMLLLGVLVLCLLAVLVFALLMFAHGGMIHPAFADDTFYIVPRRP